MMKFNLYRGGAFALLTLFSTAYSAKADHTVISDDKTEYAEKYEGIRTDGQGGVFLIEGGHTLTYLGRAEFENNYASGEGGAVYIEGGGTLTVDTANFVYNSGKAGGAIYNYLGNVNVNQYADFSQNEATDGDGGAIYNDSGEVLITASSAFYGNTATKGNGGAIYNTNEVTFKKRATFSENEAKSGGAVYGGDTSILEIGGDAEFFNNKATDGNGGALYGNRVGVSGNATFKGNTALNGDGGAIYTDKDATFDQSAEFISNKAKNGGAIYNLGEISIAGAGTFTGNEATDGNGGAIYNKGTTFEITGGATFENNKAVDGGAIYNLVQNMVFSDVATFTNNTASASGGAIFNSPANGTITFFGAVTFTGNESAQNGGAIYNAEDTCVHFSSSGEFKDNKSTNGRGGAIYNKGVITFESASYTFENNTDKYGASDIYNDGEVYFTNDNTSVKLDAIDGNGTVELYAGSNVSFASSSGSDMVLKNRILVYQNGELHINGGATFKTGYFAGDGLAIHNQGTVYLGTAGSRLDFGSTEVGKGTVYNGGEMIVDGDVYAVNNGSMYGNGGLFHNDGKLTFNGSISSDRADIYNSANGILTFAGSSYEFTGTVGKAYVVNDGEMILGKAGKSTAISLNNVLGNGTTQVVGDVTVDGNGGAVSWRNKIALAGGATLNIGTSVLNVGANNFDSSAGTLKLSISGLTADSADYVGGQFKTGGTATIGKLFVTVDPSLIFSGETGELLLLDGYTGDFTADMLGISDGYTITYTENGKFIIGCANGTCGGSTPTPTPTPPSPTPTPSSGSDVAASVYGVRATAKAVRNAVLTRADGGFVSGGYKGTSGGDEPAQYGLWAQGVAGDFHRKGASDGDVYGFVAGFDGKVSDTLTAGFGYGYTYVSEKSPDARAKTRMHNGFVYARYQPSEWFLNAVAGGGFGESEIKEGASYDTWYADANATLGKDYATQIGVITPLATLRYTFVKSDGYTADGVGYDPDDAHLLTGAAGVRWTGAFGAFKPYVTALATYDFISDDAKARVVAGGIETVLRDARTKRLGAEFGAGVSAEIADNVSVTADWRGAFTTHYRDNTASLAVRIDF